MEAAADGTAVVVGFVRVERIGDATLYEGDCLELLPTLSTVDAVVTDQALRELVGL